MEKLYKEDFDNMTLILKHSCRIYTMYVYHIKVNIYMRMLTKIPISSVVKGGWDIYTVDEDGILQRNKLHDNIMPHYKYLDSLYNNLSEHIEDSSNDQIDIDPIIISDYLYRIREQNLKIILDEGN